MASLSVPLPRKISDQQFVGDLMTLFERRKVKCGEPSSFENFASELAGNSALRGDLFTLCTAISHMAAEDLSGDQLLILVARALAGPGVAKGAALPEIPMSMRSAFLDGYAAWTNRAALAMGGPLESLPKKMAVVRAEVAPIMERDDEPVGADVVVHEGRSFKSALNIAMERSQNDLFISRRTVVELPQKTETSTSGSEEASGAVSEATLFRDYTSGRRTGKPGLAVGLGLLAVVVCAGGTMGYRLLHRTRIAPAVKTGLPVPAGQKMSHDPGHSAIAPAAAPAVSGMKALRQAVPVGGVPSARPAGRSATVQSGKGSSAIWASSGAAVAVPSDATERKNSIVEYAPPAPKKGQPATGGEGVSGTVMVEVSISKQGRVTDARAVSGPPELYSRAEQTVRQWRFNPNLVGGAPAEQTTTLGVFLNGN